MWGGDFLRFVTPAALGLRQLGQRELVKETPRTIFEIRVGRY